MSSILHVTQCLGGVETYLSSFHAHGAYHGFEARSLVVPEPCALADQWQQAGGAVTVLPIGRSIHPWHDAVAVLRLRRLLRAVCPDVLHLHSSKAGALGRAAAFLCRLQGQKMQVVYTPHAYFFLGRQGLARKAFIAIERVLGLLTDRLLATSESEGVRSINEVGFPGARVKVVSNAVSVDAAVIPASAGHAAGPFMAVFAGRICAQKNLEMLAAVMARFAPEEQIRFQIIGAGHYPQDRAQLEQLLDHHGVDRAMVEIVPWLTPPALQQRFDQAHVCLVTSRYESFGYVAAEAAARGLPVVATRVDGLQDIVEHEVTGLLVASEDADGFAAAVRSLMVDPARATRMGQRGRQRVGEHFNIVRNAERMRLFYEQLP